MLNKVSGQRFFGNEIERMREHNILYLVIAKFGEVGLHPDRVDNIQMGLLFEDLIRRFNEQANETAGDHFTPREVIRLMVNLLFMHDDALLTKPGTVRKLLDPTCGTGGMLSEARRYLREHNLGNCTSTGRTSTRAPSPWRRRICCSSKTPGSRKPRPSGSAIRCWTINSCWTASITSWRIRRSAWTGSGSTQMFYNTGIGTYVWIVTNRKEPRRRGKIQLIDARECWIPLRRSLGDKRRKFAVASLDPANPDPLADDIPFRGAALTHGYRDDIRLITESYGQSGREVLADMRLVEFVGADGKLASRIFQAADLPVPGPELGGTVRERLSGKVFDNTDFGYRRLTVERPLQLVFQISLERKERFLDACPALLDDVRAIAEALGGEARDDWNAVWKEIQALLKRRESKWLMPEAKLFRDIFTAKDPTAQPVVAKGAGKSAVYEPDPALRDFENVPLKEDVAAYFEREVKPHVPDAWIDHEKTKIGYEINFNRHFYRYTPPRPLAGIDADLKRI